MKSAFLILIIANVLLLGGAAAAPLPADIVLADGAANLGTRAAFFTAQQGYEAGSGNQSTAYGDFNRDGYDDLVIGYSATNITGTNNGFVYVVFGSASFPASQNVGSAEAASIYCQDDGAGLGYCVAAGDLDGDGIDELLIGAPGANNSRGAVAIINGTTISPSSVQAVNFSLGSPTSGETRILGTQDTAQFGYSLAVGNFDGDDKIDVAAGEPYADVDGGAKVDAGKCYVWYGKDYAAGTTTNNTAVPDRWEILGGAGDNVGTALAAGEGNDDGLDNLAIGAIGYGSSSRVYYMGVLSPGTTSYELDDVNNFNHGTIDGVPGLGFSLAMAVTSFVGRAELLMGAPLYGHDGLTNSGAVIAYLDLQTVVGFGTITLDLTSPPTATEVYLGANDGGLFGGSVAYSDLNGDGRPDIVVGEPGGPGASAETQAGRVHARYLPALRPAGEFDLADAPLDVTITGEAAFSYCGASIAGDGDVDGDGFADLLAFAPFAVQGAPGLGNAYLVYGGADPLTVRQSEGLGVKLAAGDTPTLAFGGRLSPTMRLKAQVNGGNLSLMRGDFCTGCGVETLGAPDDSNVADTYWYASTDRTGINSVVFTVNYTDADITGLTESNLALYQSESPLGPWTRAAGQMQFPDRNEFTAEIAMGEQIFLGILLEAPTITLNGFDDNFWDCGTPYVDPGATALSKVDGDVTNLLVVDDSAVDVTTLGVYEVTFNVTDSTGAPAAQVVRTVRVRDIGFPVIQLEGGPLILQCGADLVLPGYTAYDDCDGDLTNAVVITGLDTIDTHTPGHYTIFYDVMDSNGNQAQSKSRGIQVYDDLKPVVTLIGGNMQWDCGVPWVDPGATAFDACDGDITGDIVVGGNVVDTSDESNATVSYWVNDNENNFSGYVYRTVQVRDTSGPIITLVGAAEVNITCSADAEFIDEGATAVDACQGDLTDNIIVTGGPVNEEQPGIYTLHYDVSDNKGNAALSATRTIFVVDGGAPVISLNGPSEVTVACGNSYNNDDVTVFDVCEGDITFKLQVTGTVDTTTEGDYTLTFNAVDNDNNEATPVTRIVHVGSCADSIQSADQDGDFVISLLELLRAIQFYNSLGYHCADNPGDTEDGYVPGAGANQSCAPYDTDYNPQDWTISLIELLRLIQFYNSLGYNYCPDAGSEDGFCPGAA